MIEKIRLATSNQVIKDKNEDKVWPSNFVQIVTILHNGELRIYFNKKAVEFDL